MNIKQVIFINISFFISLTVLAADRPTQPVRTEVYRLERLDSVLLVDLAVDLTGVHLAPDCTVYLFPLLASENTGDSLSLPPIVLNGGICSVCMAKGTRRASQLQFVSRIHTLTSSIHAA